MSGAPAGLPLTVAHELRRAADEAPDHVFLRTRSGSLTYRDCRDRVAVVATHLQRHGVRPGQVVALVMDNSIEQVVLWFALSHLGAVHAPLNTALTGQLLRHALRTSQATLVVADGGHLDQVAEAAAGTADRRVTVRPLGWAVDVAGDRSELTAPAPVDELGTATLLFTSGTTGPSKACALSHRYLVRQGQLHAKYIEATHDDVLYCPFPLFHIDAATLTVCAALAVRGTAALAPRFSVSRFWDDVRFFEATVFNFMGATLTLLWKQPETPTDRAHRVRLAWGVPLPDWHEDFQRRFGLQLRTVYGLTDGGVPVYDPLHGPRRTDTAGRVIDEFEVRVDTARGRPGDAPGLGEILVRGREPGLTMNGYFGDARATAETLDEGWVRTGDVGRLDDGYLTFHGRLSDSIRRRGENISAFEVEELVTLDPRVLEAAAIGVPSELTEEDLLVCVVPRPGAQLPPQAVYEHVLAHGPAHLAPRYVRLMPALPKTPTQKVEKFRLKDEGVTPDTWDRERGRRTEHRTEH